MYERMWKGVEVALWLLDISHVFQLQFGYQVELSPHPPP